MVKDRFQFWLLGFVMISMLIWLFGIAGSVSVVSLAVAFDAQSLHLAATAVVSLAIVATAVNDHRAAQMAGSSKFHLAAIASRYMGILWAWSALSAYVVYGFLLTWVLWLDAVVAMSVLCIAFLFVAMMLDREALAEAPDAAANTLVGNLAKAQFGIGAVLFGAMVALRSHPALFIGGPQQWVALNLFLCSAAALMTLTGYLIMDDTPQAAANTPAEPAA